MSRRAALAWLRPLTNNQLTLPPRQVLRLLDNEAINPDELGDIKVCAAVPHTLQRCADRFMQDLVEDYVERNQDDFDEFGDVADMYESLNLDALLEKSAALCVPRVCHAQHARKR